MFRVSSFILFFFPSTLLYLYRMCVPATTIDLSTQANIDQVKTTHVHLNWNVDFERQVLYGNVVLDLVTLVDNVNKVVLDTSYLDIKSVSYGEEKLKVNKERRKEFFTQHVLTISRSYSINWLKGMLVWDLL